MVGTQRIERKDILLHADDEVNSAPHFLASGTIENLVHLSYHVSIVGIQLFCDLLLFFQGGSCSYFGIGIDEPALPSGQ